MSIIQKLKFILSEPRSTERYASWCERSVIELINYPLLDLFPEKLIKSGHFPTILSDDIEIIGSYRNSDLP